MQRAFASLVAVCLLVPACSAPAPGIEIEAAQFVNKGGCGDAFFWATNAAGTAAITVEWSGAASEAWARDSYEDTQQLPHPEITVSVVEGRDLTSYYCNDIRAPGQGPTSTTQASIGTVRISVTPTRDGFQPAGRADLRLSNVNFHVDSGSAEPWHLDELVIEDVAVGWLAG